jgi:tol-pal system protein YbgF
MKSRRVLYVAIVAVALFAMVMPVSGANKDIIQLQTQVQALQDQMARMQQSFDERMGVMRNLVEQNTDSMNKLVTSLNGLQGTLSKQTGDIGTKNDQLSGQIQALNDSLDELKARLARVTKQLEDMQAAQQNLNPGAGGAAGPGVGGQASAPGQPPQAQAPPPDILYNNAVRDYNAGKMDLAQQEFGDYVKFYPNTDLAGNATFYLAEMAYRAGNYQEAVKDYDQVLQQFPGGNKAAAAQLKKGFAMIELGDRAGGTRELNSLIRRFPRSNEAAQARERLRRLNAGTGGRTTTSRTAAPTPQ